MITNQEKAKRMAGPLRELTLAVVNYTIKTNVRGMSVGQVQDFIRDRLVEMNKDNYDVFMDLAAASIANLVVEHIQSAIREMNNTNN